MEELTTNKRIRCNFTNEDKKFFMPKASKKQESSKHFIKADTIKDHVVAKAIPKVKEKKEPKTFTLSLRFIAIILSLVIAMSVTIGGFIGVELVQHKYAEISHYQESLIRSEAIADYKATLEAEEAELAAAKMDELKSETNRRKQEVLYFAKLFEGVRDWNFDVLDLITYGICVWNRTLSPMFANTIDEVIHQKEQWINFSDNNPVVADYNKIAEKLVDLIYNSDVQLCSSKYCWIEIRDGHLYLKDSFNNYPGMILWRYQGEI